MKGIVTLGHPDSNPKPPQPTLAEKLLAAKKKHVDPGCHKFISDHSDVSMILPTWAPGKMGPQTSPNPHKERNSFINCW